MWQRSPAQLPAAREARATLDDLRARLDPSPLVRSRAAFDATLTAEQARAQGYEVPADAAKVVIGDLKQPNGLTFEEYHTIRWMVARQCGLLQAALGMGPRWDDPAPPQVAPPAERLTNLQRAAAGGAAAVARPVTRLPQLAAAPVIDGALEGDAGWAGAAELRLTLSGGAGPAEMPTEAKVGLRDGILYVGFVCHEDRLANLVAEVTEQDGPVWQDDCVELFLDPGVTEQRYYQVVVNSRGTVLRTGMPVDPGNLLVLGRLAEKPVLGAPGCARSPKENGFDWVLDRLVAGIDVGSGDIAQMGVGGLLMEIPTRPQPREAATPAGLDVEIVVLAAGQSRRMGGPNKLMALFSGKPLVRLTVETALASRASRTIVVTGHQAGRIGEALAGLGQAIVHNPEFAGGLSSSLKAGIAAVREGSAGALIMLGDMPAVSAGDLDRLIGVFRKSGGQCIVRATCRGKRGNPVILPRSLFSAMAALEGDTGARHLIEAEAAPVIDVDIGDAAAVDIDTRDALEGAGGVLQD